MATGPTTGASETDVGSWRAQPGLALGVRLLVALAPLLGAYLCLQMVGDWLYRPDGWPGLVAWMAQAIVIGALASLVIDLQTRRLLPLATLFGMSLVFPDRAPSRFSIALRSGTIRQLQRRIAEVGQHGLGEDLDEAAASALELVSALSNHDRFTRGHAERVRAYADLIGVELGLSEADQAWLSWGVLLHDVGKLAVPAEVLNKTEPLTDAEWDVLQGHPAAGAELLEPLAPWLGDWSRAAGEHHERWDGAGYPGGLAGRDISLAGRITAVADAYDVITSRRSYKKPMSAVAARRELVACAGSQFDPEVVRALLNVSLGRRWLFGPLAGLANLPWGAAGAGAATPVVATVGALAAVGSVLVAPVADDDGQAVALAYEDTGTDDLSIGPEASPATSRQPQGSTAATVTPGDSGDTAVMAGEGTGSTSGADEAIEATTRPDWTAPKPSSGGTPTNAAPTTAEPGSTTPTSAPTTAEPASTAPTTAEPGTVAPTVPAPAPTTTTVAPVADPTTSTVAPPGQFLSNTVIGDLRALETLAPGAPGLSDHDQPGDGIGGLAIGPADEGIDEVDPGQSAGWALDPGGQRLTGPVRLTLWVATAADLGGGSVNVRASLRDCNGMNYNGCPTGFASAAVNADVWVGSGGGSFQEVVLDFGAVDHQFAPNRSLVLTVVVEGASGVHLAYGAASHPSRIDLTLG